MLIRPATTDLAVASTTDQPTVQPSTVDKQVSVFVPMTVRHRATLLYIFGAYCAAVVLFGVHPAQPESWYLVGSLSLWVGTLALPIMLYKPEYGWFHPLIIPSLLSMVPLARTFPAYTWGMTHHTALPYASARELNLLLAYKTCLLALGQGFIMIGYWLARGIWAPKIRTRPWAGVQSRTLLMVVMSLVVALQFVQSRGGFERFLLTLGKGRHDALGGAHYLLMPAELGFAACVLCLACRPHLFRSPIYWAVTLIALNIEVVLTFSRSSIAVGLFAVIAVRALYTNEMPLARGAVAVVALVYAIIVIGDVRTGTTTKGRLDTTTSSGEQVGETFSRGWSESFVARATSYDAALPILARVPNDVDLLYGESYLALLATPIPRGYWKDKPNLVGGRVAKTFYNLKAGIPPGSVGESYWNFHVAGVIFVHLLGGCYLRFVTRLRERSPRDPLVTVIFTTLIFNWMPTSDSLIYALIRVTQYLLCALFMLRLGGDPTPTEFGQLSKARGVRTMR